jgi:hypothetical protein
MNNFQEPNKLNLKKGDYVVISLPYPETATIDEIANDFHHAGEVRRVYHNESGILRVEVAGLKEKIGRDWTWQDRIVSVDKKKTVFEDGEKYIEVNIFGIKAAGQRGTVKNFRGDISRINNNEYEIYSWDSGNSYVVKIEDVAKYTYNVGCTCPDFTNRERVCKHISAVFTENKLIIAVKIAA